MKVEVGKVTIVRISELERLDTIRVTLDDIEPGRGRITIECYGKAWSSYWGAMGGRSVAQFFARCDNGYLIQNLTENLRSTRYSGEALARYARKTICLRRRWRDTATICNFDDSLDRQDARRLFNDADDLENCSTPESCWNESELLSEIFGKEWFCSLGSRAEEPNPEYDYLSRICDAVREALLGLEKAS